MQATQCRSVLTRELIKGLVHAPIWDRLPAADPPLFCQQLAERGFELLLDPPRTLPPTVVTPHRFETDCSPSSGPFVIVSDGSCRGHLVGYSAVLLSPQRILEQSQGASRVHDVPSWCDKWLGRLLGTTLAQDVPGPFCFSADNLSISLREGLVEPSGSDVVDRIQAHVAACYSLRNVLEGYIPAQPDTGWLFPIVHAQRRADDLAEEAISSDAAVSASLPLLHITAPHSLLLTPCGSSLPMSFLLITTVKWPARGPLSPSLNSVMAAMPGRLW